MILGLAWSCIRPNIGGQGQPCSKYNACLAGLECKNGICVQSPDGIQGNDSGQDANCVPKTCQQIGKVCGKNYDNGCGGTLDCGACPASYKCSNKGLCVRTEDKNGISWVILPGGQFKMGCSAKIRYCKTNAMPQHQVTVKPFQIMATEVTEDMYQNIMHTDPSTYKKKGAYPVENVTWANAKEFCHQIGAVLPSEAQWEYAARAGSQTIYSCGDDKECLKRIANYAASSKARVASKKANNFGLYDMLGNVYEWVLDDYHPSYRNAPADGSAWVSKAPYDKVIRGGAYDSLATTATVFYRDKLDPDNPSSKVGFRCVKPYKP